MGDFERRVLRLVSEGKLSPEDGDELLRAHQVGTVRDIRATLEGTFADVGRYVRERTEPDERELLREDLPAGEGPLELDVEGDFALTLQPGDPGVCRAVWRSARPVLGEPQSPPDVHLEGRRLRVQGRERYGFGIAFWPFSLDVYVPEGTPLAGAIVQRWGRARIDGLPVEQLRIDQQNGRVQLDAPEVDDLIVASRNGSIEVAARQGRKLRVSAYNGRVSLRGALQDVEATTRNGGVEADLRPAADASCNLQTLNGSVELQIAPDIACTLSAETVHGAILANLPGMEVHEDSREFGRRVLRGRTEGEAGALTAHLSTTNGTVRISRGPR